MKEKDEADKFTFKLSLSEPIPSATAVDWRNLPPPVVLDEDEPEDEGEWVN